MTGEAANNAFGRLLRTRRRSLGLRQDELADLAGVSERFVYALESGKRTVQMDKAIAFSGPSVCTLNCGVEHARKFKPIYRRTRYDSAG